MFCDSAIPAKPGRYIGGEWNISAKEFDKARTKFALIFPDLYEVGMSNLGIQIIYGLLNSLEGICCERFFSCGEDLEAMLRAEGRKLFSLESKRPLKEFCLAGFSLAFELSYTNVLNILDLSGIPLEARARGKDYPLIIGGGPGVMNPEPMHKFFDLFIIGEAEEALPEFIEVYQKHQQSYKASATSKEDLLFFLSQVEGVYVPSLYEARYNAEGALAEFRPKREGVPPGVRKRFVSDLNSAYFPLSWLMPYIQIVHDRVTLELMRGCPNRCRFCQARTQYFPLRYRAADKIFELAKEVYGRTGYEEISLGGLSVGDYPRIEELIRELVEFFRKKAVALSLPSLKAKKLIGELSSSVARIKKTGLTFAPEAATARLRCLLGKDFNEEEFLKVAEEAFLSGYQHLKLYFMTGIPFEKDEDIDGIVDFSLRVSDLRRKSAGRPAQINISINTLIPKPHTSFQWFAMQSLKEMKDTHRRIKSRARSRELKFSFHNPEMSFLEGVLSRGDRRLADVILCAFKKGARFDAWTDQFNFNLWMSAFDETGIRADFYLRRRPESELLPWDFLEAGISKKSLLEEFNKVVDKQSC